MRLAPVVLCGAALLTRSGLALACGAQYEPYYVPGEQLPNGGSVRLNAPLVVELSESADGPAESHLDPSLTLLVGGTDEAIAVRAIGIAPYLVWVPEEPLEARTTYEARFNAGYEGGSDNVWGFTTGDELALPVAMDGELRVTFEAGTDPITECGNNCGTDCKEVGRRAVTKARVRLPRAMHGFPSYRGMVRLTGAHLVNLQSWVSYDERGEPAQDALFTLPEEEEPYRPCISFSLVDERGDSATAAPFCAETTFPFTQPLTPTVDDSKHDSGDPASAGTSSACQFSPPPSGSSVTLASGLALAALTRRRRSKTAL